MFIMLSREVGSLIVSDTVVTCPRCIELDGRTIRREDYPELFKWGGAKADTWRLPDQRGTIPGASMWIVAQAEWCGRCYTKGKHCADFAGVP